MSMKSTAVCGGVGIVGVFDYDSVKLNAMANEIANKIGILVGWAIRVHTGGASLVVTYRFQKQWYEPGEPYRTGTVTAAL